MIVGFALLTNSFNMLLLLILNLLVTQALYAEYIKKAVEKPWIGYLAFLGTYTVLLILGAVWTAYLGNGVIEDIEFFKYFQYQ